MKEHQEPYQYMLFIFGDFKGKDKIIELIALQLSAFTDKHSYVKYNYGDYGIILNFQSHLSFYNIRDHVHIILEKVAPQYFLFERPKHMYAFMPPELKINLFDLYEENTNIEQKNVNFKDGMNLIDNFFINMTSSFSMDDVLSEEDMEKMFENIMYKLDSKLETIENKKPTVDDILDKIKKDGIDSLTNIEKQILDEYSKT
jgi:hypothetical protein